MLRIADAQARLHDTSNWRPQGYGGRQQLAYLGVVSEEERNYSEDTARLIDTEVRLRREVT